MNRNNMNEQTKSSTAKSGGRKLRNDLIFIGVLLAVVICLGLGFYFLRPGGDEVVVMVDGRVFGTYPLDTDAEIEICTGEHGEQRNLLIIKDGWAYVQEATCPDGICAAHKPITRQGESIVCLPNKVVITVQTRDADSGPDVVA